MRNMKNTILLIVTLITVAAVVSITAHHTLLKQDYQVLDVPEDTSVETSAQ
jgi:hypothetical protein